MHTRIRRSTWVDHLSASPFLLKTLRLFQTEWYNCFRIKNNHSSSRVSPALPLGSRIKGQRANLARSAAKAHQVALLFSHVFPRMSVCVKPCCSSSFKGRRIHLTFCTIRQKICNANPCLNCQVNRERVRSGIKFE